MERPERDRCLGGYREILPESIRKCAPRAFDIVGDIAIVRISPECLEYAEEIGRAITQFHRNIRVVCVDNGVEDEYRIRNVSIVYGENRLVTIHSEFGCRFKVDLGKVYFSPRLSTERWRVVECARVHEKVIDMFAGIGPFSILLAKYKKCQCISIDINPHAISLMKENIRLNKVENFIEVRTGDARDILKEIELKADRIIMNHPTKAFEFLDVALEKCKAGSTIHYYSIFVRGSEKDELDRVKRKVREHGFEANIKYRLVRETSPSKVHYAFDITLI